MKATIDVPDELYRRVKAKSALNGQRVREVVIDLFQEWLDAAVEPAAEAGTVRERSVPAWFGAARKYAAKVGKHDIGSIRASIVRGRAMVEPASSSAKGAGR